MWARVLYWAKKIPRDMALTLYDDFAFRYMSFPRLTGAISVITVVIAWIGEQFYGYKYDNFGQIVTWSIACMAAYAVKKYAERNKDYSNPLDKEQNP